jgi:Flp pilus assembly protein TadD
LNSVITAPLTISAFYLRIEASLRRQKPLNRQGLELGSNEAAYNLGVLLQQQGRAEEAEAAYRKALDLGFGGAAASNLGVLLGEQGRFKEAEAMYHKALKLGENDYIVAFNLGVCLTFPAE